MELQRAQQSEPGQDLGYNLEPRRAGHRSPKGNGLPGSWVVSTRTKHRIGSGAARGATLPLLQRLEQVRYPRDTEQPIYKAHCKQQDYVSTSRFQSAAACRKRYYLDA